MPATGRMEGLLHPWLDLHRRQQRIQHPASPRVRPAQPAMGQHIGIAAMAEAMSCRRNSICPVVNSSDAR